jgi:hypothetical protein
MNNNQIPHVIHMLVEQFLLARQDTTCRRGAFTTNGNMEYAYTSVRTGTPGLYFRVRIDQENFGYEKDGHTQHPEWRRRSIRVAHLIVTRNRNVFLAVSSNLRDKPESEDFRNISNHDSCWRDAIESEIRNLECVTYDDCFQHVPYPHRPAPVMVPPSIRLESSMFNAFTVVKIKGTYKDDNWTLSEIKHLEFALNILDDAEHLADE